MNIREVRSVYFLGIGGIGMSALARFFHSKGKNVSGYDHTETDLTRQLVKEGIPVHYEDDPAMIPDYIDLVVYTPAIPKSIREFAYLSQQYVAIRKRSEVLGMISEEYPTIAIAGSHGKTTITGLLTHIFKTAEIPVLSFVGGITANYKTNFFYADDPQWCIVEADEFDRSFLELKPSAILISSVDFDHSDIYMDQDDLEKTFRKFARKLRIGGFLIMSEKIKKFADKIPLLKRRFYGFNKESHYHFKNITLQRSEYEATCETRYKTFDVMAPATGMHNLENALGALAIAREIGIDNSAILQAIRTYKGIKRRFEVWVHNKNRIYIDDYAHHPEEIKACINSARDLFPDKNMTVVFQPHLFSRTQSLSNEFAHCLSKADKVVLLNIYPARELPVKGVNSKMLLTKIENKNKILLNDDQLIDHLNSDKPELLITMGAGNIDRFAPMIARIMNN